MSRQYVTDELVNLFVGTWNSSNSTDPYLYVRRETINWGWCYQFAILMRRLHGKKAKLCYDQGHAWVKIGKKYYDSDRQDGVTRASQLGGARADHVDVSERELIKFWEGPGGGRSGKVRHDIIDEVVSAYKRLNRR
jgi:hypothetical protein